MKTTILVIGLLGALAGGCTSSRTPEMYRDDTQKVLETKSTDIKACYDNFLKAQPGMTGPGGRVTVKFTVSDDTGKLENVAIDQPNTTAPQPVAECVKTGLQGLSLTPVDGKAGDATFVYEFSQPPAPPAGAAPMAPMAPKS